MSTSVNVIGRKEGLEQVAFLAEGIGAAANYLRSKFGSDGKAIAEVERCARTLLKATEGFTNAATVLGLFSVLATISVEAQQELPTHAE